MWAEYRGGSIPDPEIPGSERVCLTPGQSLHFGNIPGRAGMGLLVRFGVLLVVTAKEIIVPETAGRSLENRVDI